MKKNLLFVIINHWADRLFRKILLYFINRLFLLRAVTVRYPRKRKWARFWRCSPSSSRSNLIFHANAWWCGPKNCVITIPVSYHINRDSVLYVMFVMLLNNSHALNINRLLDDNFYHFKSAFLCLCKEFFFFSTVYNKYLSHKRNWLRIYRAHNHSSNTTSTHFHLQCAERPRSQVVEETTNTSAKATRLAEERINSYFPCLNMPIQQRMGRDVYVYIYT